ncbi:MAG: hypothetical protein WBE50_08190, partial [Methyloceanibacter sp.]
SGWTETVCGLATGMVPTTSLVAVSTIAIRSSPFLSFAAAGALVALTAVGTSARADDLPQSLGPVGPNETILTTFGKKRVIAFYEADNGRCAVNAVVYDKTDAYTGMTTAARVRVSLNPRQMVHIDSTIMRRSTSSAETMPKR